MLKHGRQFRKSELCDWSEVVPANISQRHWTKQGRLLMYNRHKTDLEQNLGVHCIEATKLRGGIIDSD